MLCRQVSYPRNVLNVFASIIIIIITEILVRHYIKNIGALQCHQSLLLSDKFVIHA